MNERIKNLSKSILKRLQSGRNMDDELIYAFEDAVTERLEQYDEDFTSEEYLRLKERIDSMWNHQIYSDCISSSVFPKNRKEKFPTLGMGYSHISAGNIFI